MLACLHPERKLHVCTPLRTYVQCVDDVDPGTVLPTTVCEHTHTCAHAHTHPSFLIPTEEHFLLSSPLPLPLLLQVQELQAAADHAMMLKFGRIVDLDRLEGLHINKTAEDLRMKIEAVERRRAQAVLDMEVQSREKGANRTYVHSILCHSPLLPTTYVHSWHA